jgi:oligosaccharide repeat unit polymerase
MAAAALAVIAGIFLWLSWMLTKAVRGSVSLTAGIVFFGVWSVCSLALACDTWLGVFREDINTGALMLYAVSFVSFFLGTSTVVVACSKRQVQCQEPVGLGDVTLAALRKVVWIGLLIFTAGVAYKYTILFSNYGNPLEALFQIRHDYTTGNLQFPSYLGLLTVLANLLALNLALLAAQRRPLITIEIAITLVLSVLNDATIADKGSMRLVFLFTFAMLLLRPGLIRLRSLPRVSSMILVGLAAFSVVTWFRISEPARDQEAGFVTTNLVHFYSNTVGNLVSLNWFLDYPMTSTVPGERTFDGVYRFAEGAFKSLGIDVQFVSEAFQMNPDDPTQFADILNIGVYNTRNHLAFYYYDFGVIGIAVLPFLLGVMASYAECCAAYTRRVGYIFAAALWFVCLLSTIRGVYFGAIGFWITLLCIYMQAVTFTSGGQTGGKSYLPSRS